MPVRLWPIIDAYASPTIVQDVNQWSTQPRAADVERRAVPRRSSRRARSAAPQNKQQDPQGWYGEETLDVEAVHGMAPAANIVYVGAPNNYQDLDAAMNHVVDRHLAQIVTNSYGFSTTELLPPGLREADGGHADPGGRRGHRRLLLVR